MEFLISAEKLNNDLSSNDVVIIDVRPTEDYQKLHIKGSISIPEIFTYLPTGLTSKSEIDEFCNFYNKIFNERGIQNDHTIVFYEDKYTLKSPRGLGILKYFGHDESKIKVLEGGFDNWKDLNLATSKETPSLSFSNYTISIDKDFFVDYNEMLDVIEDDDTIILDVRDQDEWLGISSSPYGIDYAPKKGRLPNAVWIEWYKFITGDMLRIEKLKEIQEELLQKNIQKNSKIVLYCFKGARLSNSYIALRKLGYENIRLYFAGWNEWCRKEGAPLINESLEDDNPILKENIALKIKLDKLNLKTSKLVSFPKYNKEPIFAFDRDGNLYSENQSTRDKLPHVKTIWDIIDEISLDDIYTIIDNNTFSTKVIEYNDEYYSINMQGAREVNAILMYAFNITELHRLNANLEVEVLSRTQDINESNDKLKSSIRYSALVQHAILPDASLLSNFIDDSFVMWEPKDVVGGDIYTYAEIKRGDEECVIMLIDCTGHGVAGALVSMIVKSVEREVISKIYNENIIDVSPAWILEYFNKAMKKLLKQHDRSAKSNVGFDGYVLYYNKTKKILKFAGANSEIIYIQDNELKTIKGNRHSIGYKTSKDDYVYTDYSIPLDKETFVYMTSDGYLDQLSEDTQIQFGKKRYKALLMQMYQDDMSVQKEKLRTALIIHQKDEERLDDITTIGLRIKP